MSWTLAQSGSALFERAGVGVSTKLSGSNVLTQWSDEAEAQLSVITRKDWVGDYSDVTTNFKQALSDNVIARIAKKLVASNFDGYKLAEAQTLLNVLRDDINQSNSELKPKENQKVMEQ